jgi:Xaa-Pro aminopeptidase
MFELAETQKLLNEYGLDGWLLFDFRRSNMLATRVLDIPADRHYSRRWYYYIPARGAPRKLVHRIESGALDHLPGERTIYLRWQELEAGVASLVQGARRIAMEYSPRNANPYVATVDGGTLELVRSCGPEIVSSGDLVQAFEARWTPRQWELHLEADRLNQQAFEMAWSEIAAAVRRGKALQESELQQRVVDFYRQHNLVTDHPPIVGVGPHSGDPHYSPQAGADSAIQRDNFVLLDMWCKVDDPEGVYSDLTKVGFVGAQVPDKYQSIFAIVAAARDAGIAQVRSGLAQGELFGWQVDQATRHVIQQAGYGDRFVHRTGHNIGRETHGNGAHMDNLETQETRRVMRRTCFSIEPGIYLDEFGVRSEINVYVDDKGQPHITGGLQTEVLAILK